MPRIRQIKPEYFLDEEIAAVCSRDARLLFVGLWTIADREGRLEDRPFKIKAQIFPYDEDISPELITGLLDQLERGSFIFRYSVETRRYILIRTFTKHQHCHVKEQHSQIPEPPEDIEKHRTSTGLAPDLHRTSPSASTSTYGIRNLGTPVGVGAKKPRTSKKTGCPVPFDIADSLKEWASKAVPGLNVEAETEKFLDHHRAAGSSFMDWDAAWRKWMRNAAEWGKARTNRGNGGHPHATDKRDFDGHPDEAPGSTSERRTSRGDPIYVPKQ